MSDFYGQKGSEDMRKYDPASAVENIASVMTPGLADSLTRMNLYRPVGAAVHRQRVLGNSRLGGITGVPKNIASIRSMRRNTHNVLQELRRASSNMRKRAELKSVGDVVGAMSQEGNILGSYASREAQNRYQLASSAAEQKTRKYLSHKRATYGALGGLASFGFGMLGEKFLAPQIDKWFGGGEGEAGGRPSPGDYWTRKASGMLSGMLGG